MNYNELKQIAKKQNILIKDLASEIVITRQGLQKVLDNGTIEIRKVKRICEILKISPLLFFDMVPEASVNVTELQSKETENSLLRDRIKDKDEIIHMLRERMGMNVAATPKIEYKSKK